MKRNLSARCFRHCSSTVTDSGGTVMDGDGWVACWVTVGFWLLYCHCVSAAEPGLNGVVTVALKVVLRLMYASA